MSTNNHPPQRIGIQLGGPPLIGQPTATVQLPSLDVLIKIHPQHNASPGDAVLSQVILTLGMLAQQIADLQVAVASRVPRDGGLLDARLPDEQAAIERMHAIVEERRAAQAQAQASADGGD